MCRSIIPGIKVQWLTSIISASGAIRASLPEPIDLIRFPSRTMTGSCSTGPPVPSMRVLPLMAFTRVSVTVWSLLVGNDQGAIVGWVEAHKGPARGKRFYRAETHHDMHSELQVCWRIVCWWVAALQSSL